MTVETIHIDQLFPFLVGAFEGDHELAAYFDPGCSVNSWQDCCTAIDQKIRVNYPLAMIRGVRQEDKPIGYYIVEKDMLISFGIHRSYRNEQKLPFFWSCIKNEFSGPFSCVLYSVNSRAIGWLKKSGMKLLFDHVSILQLCPQED